LIISVEISVKPILALLASFSALLVEIIGFFEPESITGLILTEGWVIGVFFTFWSALGWAWLL